MNIICVQVFSQDIGDDLVVTIPGVEKEEIRDNWQCEPNLAQI